MKEGGDDIQALIGAMARLPGLGPRSARRIILSLIGRRPEQMVQLSRLMARVAENARPCSRCGNITDQDLCQICTDPARQCGELCIVEDVADLWALERGHAFRGCYHVLGGTLSALDDIGPDDLGIPRLLTRIESESISEVILALNATVEGQTTAHYIADNLPKTLTVTGLAQGVPIGGELDYLDDGTITAALRARRRF